MGIGEVLSLAGKSLKEKYKSTIKLVLAYMLYVFCIYILGAFIAGFLSVIPAIGGLLSTIVIVGLVFIIVPVTFGYMKQFILLYNGDESLKAFAFVDIGKQNRSMVWKVTLSLSLKYIIPIILIFGGIVGMSLSMFSMGDDGFGVSALSVVAMIAGYIWIFVLALSYSFVNNELAYGENNRTAKEIIKDSAEIMKGNKGTFFVLQIIMGIFSGILSGITESESALLNLIALLVMLCLYVPYSQYVFVAFYQGIRNPKMINDVEEPNNIEMQNDNVNI